MGCILTHFFLSRVFSPTLKQLAGRWFQGTSGVYSRAVPLSSTMCWNIPRSRSTITLSPLTVISAPWSPRMERWSRRVFTHCVTWRVSGASSPRNLAADKTCRLPKQHQSVAAFSPLVCCQISEWGFTQLWQNICGSVLCIKKDAFTWSADVCISHMSTDAGYERVYVKLKSSVGDARYFWFWCCLAAEKCFGCFWI